MGVKVVTVMRWYAQDEVNQEDSEQNEVDGMKKEADWSVTESRGSDRCNTRAVCQVAPLESRVQAG